MSCGNSVPRSQTNQSSSCCWVFWRSSPSRFWRVASCVSPPRPSCASMCNCFKVYATNLPRCWVRCLEKNQSAPKSHLLQRGAVVQLLPAGRLLIVHHMNFCGLRKGFGLPTGLWKKGIPNIDRVQGPYSEMHWDSARSKNLNSPVLAFWWRQRRTLGC